MKLLPLILSVSHSTLLSASTIRLGVLNDLHLDLNYNHNCSFPICEDLGSYSADAPVALLKEVMSDMKGVYNDQSNADEKIDVILLTGDLVKHGISCTEKETECKILP